MSQQNPIRQSLDARLSSLQPSAARRARLASYEDFNRRQDTRYLAPSDISFCKIAFPNALFGASLPPLFDAFYALNTTESDCYERLIFFGRRIKSHRSLLRSI